MDLCNVVKDPIKNFDSWTLLWYMLQVYVFQFLVVLHGRETKSLSEGIPKTLWFFLAVGCTT